MPVPLAYPQLLTNSAWQKEKGIVAKVSAKETGLGKVLDTANDLYKRIDWTKFDVAKQKKMYSTFDVLKKQKESDAYHGEVIKPLQAALGEVNKLALKVAKDFKDNSIIPKSSREYVDKIATEAKSFTEKLDLTGDHFKKVGEEFSAKAKSIETEIKRGKETVRKAWQDVKSRIDGFSRKMGDYEKEVEKFNTFKKNVFNKMKPDPMNKLSMQAYHHEIKRDLEKVDTVGKELVTSFKLLISDIKQFKTALEKHPIEVVAAMVKPEWEKFAKDDYAAKTVKDIPAKMSELLKQLEAIGVVLKS